MDPLQELFDEVNRDTKYLRDFSQIPAKDKLTILCVAREFVQEHWRDARLVYSDPDAYGEPRYAAIAIVKTLLNNYQQYAKTQHAPQMLSTWKLWNTIELRPQIECELWMEAFAFCRWEYFRKGRPCPQYDHHTQVKLEQWQRKQRDVLFTQGVQALIDLKEK